MPHGVVRETIPASAAEVFALLHDYDRRLEWDTLLSEAYLTDGYQTAQVGATSLCRGQRHLGSIALQTIYISFRPPHVAAVKLVNRPPFFDTFAATIRHADVSERLSTVEYTYHFTARPVILRFVAHPLMTAIFRWETRQRLSSLRRHFERVRHASLKPSSSPDE